MEPPAEDFVNLSDADGFAVAKEEKDKPCASKFTLLEIALVLARFDHVTSRIVNANHSIM